MSTVTVTPSQSRPSPFREDCWSEDATRTLLDAWADRYLTLDRGNLRQHDWCEVADAVNDRHHGGVKNTNSRRRRTDVQCKHRIDTLKKRYKVEKSKSVEFGGAYVSAWPFFARLNNLIGTSIHSKKASTVTRRPPGLDFMTPIPVAPRSATVKRPAKVVSPAEKISGDDTFFRLNLSTFADMAARLADDDSDSSSKSRSKSPVNHHKITPGFDFTSRIPVAPRSATVTVPAKVSSPPEMISGDGDKFFQLNNFSAFVDMAARLADDDSDSSRSRPRSKSIVCASRRRKRKNESLDRNQNLRCADVLAEAMGKFGEIYERVEGAKQRQMVELEKQRMQFARDLEVHRMKMYVDTQVQLEKLKRARRSHRTDSYS